MSKLQVDDIVNKDNTGSVGFSRGAVVTGVVTATGGSFSGNVSVGGSLTYEDVTNIDSVGLITARKGIIATGVVTATSFSGSGANLTGIDAAPSTTATASGALANGDTIIVNANGTVSAVSGNANALGSAVQIHGDSRFDIAAVYDTSNDKVVVCYREDDDGDAGMAVVGTVSGNSISFGTPVEFVSAASFLDVCFDSTNNKVVVVYTDAADSSKGKAIVGTVSGTSISFGTPAQFEAGVTTQIGCGFDQSRGKVVIVYRDDGDGDVGKGVIATVSGTSISFGTVVQYESNVVTPSVVYDSTNNKTLVVFRDFSEGSTQGSVIVITGNGTTFSTEGLARFTTGTIETPRACFDPDTGQVIIAYKDSAASSKGKVITCDASTTTPTFGTAVVFNDGDTRNMNIAYDTGANKVAIIYEDHDNSEAGKLVAGTVSGTTVTLETSQTQTILTTKFAEYNDIVYDSDENRIVAFYTDDTANAQPLRARVARISSTNLTTKNYIGISDAAYSNGATATVQIVGSVDDAQSSLTPGQQYFIQNDGSLGLTASIPSVVAGTAIAATKLIVKG